MIPLRFRVLRPYAASLIHCEFERPPIREVFHWLSQPGKIERAARWIRSTEEEGDFIKIHFKDGPDTPFYYSKRCSWIDLCQTIDEIRNPSNWHYFFNDRVKITPGAVVVDAGAAEGLFAYFTASVASKIYLVEPMPVWRKGLELTFASFSNVSIIPSALSHRQATLRMTDNEIYSAISNSGTIEVDVTTIDAIAAKERCRIDFIKADVEGYEMQLLLGAEEVIRSNRPSIAMTTYHRQNHFPEMKSYLQSLHENYVFSTRGISEHGSPVMMHVG